MTELAVQLKVQGIDYEALFRHWPYAKPEPKGRWNYLTHVVNLSMAIKSEALYLSFMGNESSGSGRANLEILLRDHGMPIGHFTGDECLAGKSPLQGTELCGVVEAMYSYEWLLALSGDDYWADRLEMLAFNALPATTSADMWTHQYDQMTNQVQCAKLETSHFLTNGEEAHLFGLEPNYGCCTANFGQGWPKFALSGLFREKDCIALGAIIPCKLSTSVKGIPVSIEVITNYPFEDSYRVIVSAEKPTEISLSLRIPGSATGAWVNGEKLPENTTRRTITQVFENKAEIKVEMNFPAELLRHDEGLHFLCRGNVVFSLPIKSRWEKREYIRNEVERKFPYCDYELYPESPWNYSFLGSKFSYRQNEISNTFFDPAHAPVSIRARMAPITWPLQDGVVASLPTDLSPTGEETELDLVPYGCTDLRMTVMPLIQEK